MKFRLVEENNYKKKKAHGWFYTMGGDPETSKDKLNHALGSDMYGEGESSSTSSESSTLGGDGGASGGGMGEALKESSEYYNTQQKLSELVKAGIIYNPEHFKDANQINAIYNKYKDKLQNNTSTKETSNSNAKYNNSNYTNNKSWFTTFEDTDIYKHEKGYFIVDGSDRQFGSLEQAKDYIQGIGDY